MVHVCPGRVRLKTTRRLGEAEARDLLDRLDRHPAVRETRYTGSNGSLTLTYTPGVTLRDLLASLPEAIPGARPSGPPLSSGKGLARRFAVPAIAIAAGVMGVPFASTAIIATCGVPIGRRAAISLAGRHLSIDVLDATAVVLLLATGDILAAGLSVGLIETGERLRSQARGRARHVLRGWMGGDSRGVRVIVDGSEPRRPLEEIVIGDLAVVYAGETIPIDGMVVSGEAGVDNRTWTGEPYPVPVGPGDSVLAGGSVFDGRLVIEVRATGEDTRAGRLASALEDAIAANTRVSDMARAIADKFVLPLLVLAVFVYGVTGDVSRLVSILIVDFGTGIRIAVPTSVLTSMIAAARQQILFRSGNAIENLAHVDTIIFDKTGTLTTGRPTVERVTLHNGLSQAEVIQLAGAAEGHLPHPIARAIRRHARRQGLDMPEPSDVLYHHGGGVEATIEGRHVVVGERRLLESLGIAYPHVMGDDASVVAVAVDGEFSAFIELRDTVRPDALEAVAALRAKGVKTLWLATGDRSAAAATVARRLGLDGYTAQMLPEDKAALVAKMQAEGKSVAVVGDGINDAAAMAEAHVGIAVARGAELARETADVVLAAEDLMLLSKAVGIAHEAMALVNQNIALVGIPNSIALVLATMGLLPPLAATVANNGSTIVAGANALRPLRTSKAKEPVRAALPAGA